MGRVSSLHPGIGSNTASLQEETLYDTIKPPAAAAGPCSDQRASPPGRMDEPAPNALVVRIGIPDLQQTKCLRLNPDVPVWASKQRILCTLNHSLKDVLNYGLFQPAFNGRAGKFLDEERLLREYPLNPETPVPYLEVPACCPVPRFSVRVDPRSTSGSGAARAATPQQGFWLLGLALGAAPLGGLSRPRALSRREAGGLIYVFRAFGPLSAQEPFHGRIKKMRQ
uniref:Uncharacterized protein n=1 Tax=Varanus komodoensis TaxID=61221 RepID=A0A8D2LVL7_VARKO